MIFFKSRKIKNLENRLSDLEFKFHALSTCSCVERVFGNHNYGPYWKEYCPNCKRVHKWFLSEKEFLEAKVVYVESIQEKIKEKINSLEN